MLRELLILRHGEAKPRDPAHGADGDFRRDVTDRGKRDAQRLGVWIARNDLFPDCVISSPARRAKTTAQKACKSGGMTADVIQFDERMYNAGLSHLLEVLRELPVDTKRVLLVGHNPGMERLVSELSPQPVQQMDNVGGLPPAGLAHFRVDVDWSEIGADCGECIQVILPDDLPRTFPFPDANGTEQRSRPAYYYRQSSVIPYRASGDEIEVLIVSSSKQKHWVVPKGIHDPGKTAQASAATEALEEAGVEGEVSDTVVGEYRYAKWDATCTVTVYPMKVTRVLPEEEWEESHRGRKWVKVAEAAQMVRNDDVKRLIAKLPAVIGQ